MTDASKIVIGGGELEIISISERRPDVPTLLFLHEGLGSAGLWRDLPAAIAERTGCAAVVYSRYGNGFSSPLREPRTPAYMHDEALVKLPALISALGLDDVVLFGHSDGASIAIIFAAEHPDAVRGLVVEAPHLFVEDLSVRSIAAIREEYERGDLRKRMSRYHADVDRTFYGWNDIWLAPEFRNWNIEDYAARVQTPALAFQGLDDQYGTPGQVETLARLSAAPVDRMLLARCGHAPHRDRSTLISGITSVWIEQLC